MAAITRMTIRVCYIRRFNLDDYMFLLAFLACIIANGLNFFSERITYLVIAITQESSLPSEDLFSELGDSIYKGIAAEIFMWTTIYSIKFTFLFYFRTIVSRIFRLEVWWWVNLVVLIPNTVISVFGTFVVCLHVDSKTLGDANDHSW